MANIVEITDFQAPELDVYARLTEAQLLNRFEPKKGMFIAESPKVIDRALDAGCIPVSCAKETGCKAYAVELYDKAFSYLQKNIAHNNADVTAIKGDALDNSHFAGVEFDAVFSNPPYLTRDEMISLQREVKYEPETALFGGDDGLYFYRQLFSLWKCRLKKTGFFAVEVGDKQAEAVRAIMESEGFSAEIVNDYQEIGRVVVGTFKTQ